MDFEVLKERTQDWFLFLQQVRELMQKLNYQEVQTPTLVQAGALEAELEPMETRFSFGSKNLSLQLPTSPEFHMKKLLAMGWPSIFEIKNCFRDREFSSIHRPEFTMLEFYKKGALLNDLKKEVESFVMRLAELKGLKPHTLHLSVSQAFAQIGFDLTPSTSAQELLEFCKTQGIDTHISDDFNDLFFRVWIEKIEPYFDPQQLLFVSDYPPSQAALSEVSDWGWAQRFEIYWKGLELGNAFQELRDSQKLKSRYEQENKKREQKGLAFHPEDVDLFKATQNLPVCSGIAIGLERLFMAIHGYKEISEFKVLDFQV